VLDAAKNFIKIQWDKPKRDGGAPVTGYNIERKDPRTGNWNKVNDEPVKVRFSVFILHLTFAVTLAQSSLKEKIYAITTWLKIGRHLEATHRVRIHAVLLLTLTLTLTFDLSI